MSFGRTIVENEGKMHRVDKMWVTPYFDFQLYFDAHNTWVDLQAVLSVIQGLDVWNLFFDFSTDQPDGDMLSIESDTQNIILGISDGQLVLSDTMGLDTITAQTVETVNDGQMHTLQLEVTGSGHNLYIDGEFFNHSYATGTSSTPLAIPSVITAASLGKGELTGFFAGTIKNLRFTAGDETNLVYLKINDNGQYVQDLISGNFGQVYNAFWEDGFNADPIFREVVNAYVCNEAGAWQNVHIG